MTERIGIYGAAGYTGRELIRLIHTHPEMAVDFATSDSEAGETVEGVTLVPRAEADLSAVDLVFLCTPHRASANLVAEVLAAGVKVLDLSADLRLKTPEQYTTWYGEDHPQPQLLPTAYGLPEFHRDDIVGQDRIANPGCYPTTTLLALRPLAAVGAMDANAPLIVDAKSGVSGAGRKASLGTHFVEVFGDFKPYNIGRSHRHTGEIEQELVAVDPSLQDKLIFSPHLLPIDRGLLATCYVTLAEGWTYKKARQVLDEAYCFEPLVTLLPEGATACIRDVARTNGAIISTHPATTNTLIVVSALDNLLKGASSQALQNANLMLSLPETIGLVAS